MRQGQKSIQLNKSQIEQSLKSAVDELTPDIFDKLDLSVPQEPAWNSEMQAREQILKYQRRLRTAALASAACLCVVMAGGGAVHYHVVNNRIESVIGLDVNPSVELSINRKERVLQARALNEDGEELLDGMDLDGVELNVAVNAVVGSMVTHGYLDDLDNAILVTVSNDSVRKAKELRASVVRDIENTLSENQLQAVVYDQQVIEDDQVKELAEEYDISYGKAYFLYELIDQNDDLTMDDMGELSSMTMEEIAAEIASRSYALGELADKASEAEPTETETVPAETEPETESEAETEEEATEAESETEAETPAQSAAEETAEATTEAAPEVEEDLVEIDYVDCEGDTVYVSFVTRVKWKNPTVAVRDEEGNSYAALVDETSRDDCVISVSGMEGGRSYTFVLGGLIPVEGDTATTVTGYFEKPEIAAEATEPYDEDRTSEDDDDDEVGDVRDDEENPGETAEPGTDSGSESGGPEGDAGESDGEQDNGHGDGQNGGQNDGRGDGQNSGQNDGRGDGQDGRQNDGRSDGQDSRQNDGRSDGQDGGQNDEMKHEQNDGRGRDGSPEDEIQAYGENPAEELQVSKDSPADVQVESGS